MAIPGPVTLVPCPSLSSFLLLKNGNEVWSIRGTDLNMLQIVGV